MPSCAVGATAGKQLDAFGVFVLRGIREASEKAELICHDVDAVKQVLIENQIYQNTFKIADQIRRKLEKKIEQLEDQQKELENYITAVTNS